MASGIDKVDHLSTSQKTYKLLRTIETFVPPITITVVWALRDTRARLYPLT